VGAVSPSGVRPSPCGSSPCFGLGSCCKTTQWLNYSARGVGSILARGLKDRSLSRGGVPDCRPEIFEYSRHSVWLLWHLNSV